MGFAKSNVVHPKTRETIKNNQKKVTQRDRNRKGDQHLQIMHNDIHWCD